VHKVKVYKSKFIDGHKVKVYKSKFIDGRWYVTCLGCETDEWVPSDGEGWYGRRTWAEAFALGVQHQREEATWVRNFG
jgi:hypothetical protein